MYFKLLFYQRYPNLMPNPALTRNKMGWHAASLSALSEAFAGACGPGARALDIGSGSGIAARAALAAGAVVTANDIDTTALDAPGARIVSARFPRELHFEDGSFDLVHAASVFHFLTGNQVAYGLRSIRRWLRPGGRLFVQAATPYQAAFAPFIAEFERRKGAGLQWPGWIEKTAVWSTHKRLGNMPSSVHLFDDATLARYAEEAGLQVESARPFRRADLNPSLFLDGRETVGLIARSV